MTDTFELLPHLENTVPKNGYGAHQSKFNIALEAWRRGIEVTFEKNGSLIDFNLSYKGKLHKFKTSYGDLTSSGAIKISRDKALTKVYLAKAGIPVAEGKEFLEDADDGSITDYCREIGFPVVLKPTNGIKGQGVVTNIQTEEELEDAIKYVRHKLNYKNVIVERYIVGDELRVYYLENKVLGAYMKKPASVIGDGKKTIAQLIEEKNEEKKTSPYLASRLIKIDLEVKNTLKKSNYTLKSVPVDGERVYLQGKCNLSAGGDSIEITEQLPAYIYDMATKISSAIPGLIHGGIDIIANFESEEAIVLEINHNAAFGGLLFPTIGKARDIPKALIDYYFPETKDNERTTLFFDLTSIMNALNGMSVKQITVTPVEPGKIHAKKYVVYGQVEDADYRTRIRLEAMKRNLHGYAKVKGRNLEVVVAGINQENVDSFNEILSKGHKKATVEKVVSENWDYPVRVGFESVMRKRKDPLKELNNLVENEKLLNEDLKHRMNELIDKCNMIENSKIWRYTKALRDVKKKVAKR